MKRMCQVAVSILAGAVSAGIVCVVAESAGILSTPVGRVLIDAVTLRDGEDGRPGPAGAPGPRGHTGSTGKTGPEGQRGDVGETGPAGRRGPRGATGRDGAPGRDGNPGTAGTPGQTGTLGPKGETGPMGPSGPQGETGPQGPAGVTPTFGYGSFLSDATYNLAARYLPLAMTVNTTIAASGTTVVDDAGTACAGGTNCSAIRIDSPGMWNIEFSAQLWKPANNNSNIPVDIWLSVKRAGGSWEDVPLSNTTVYLTSAIDKVVAAWNFLGGFSAGDQFRLLFSSSHNQATVVQMHTGASDGYTTPAPPVIPSLILSVTQESPE